MKHTQCSIIHRFMRGYLGLFFLKASIILVLVTVTSCSKENELHFDNYAPPQYELFKASLKSTGKQILEATNDQRINLHDSSGFTLDIDRSTELLSALVTESRELLAFYGIGDSELEESFYDLEDPQIALVGLVMFVNFERDQETLANQYKFSVFNELHAQNWNDIDKILNCAAIALGIDLITSLASVQGSGMDKWTKKSLKKLIGKVAGRMLGPVGVAITIGSFVLCMNDWD